MRTRTRYHCGERVRFSQNVCKNTQKELPFAKGIWASPPKNKYLRDRVPLPDPMGVNWLLRNEPDTSSKNMF